MKAKSIPESRLPDLSLPEDLQHPINRLRGIDNYCETLMSERGGYRESTTELRNCEDGARIALEMARRKVAERGEGDPLADLYHRECARLVRIRSDFCEQHFRRLCDLANAMRLAMPDLLLKCKVIALHPARLDRRDNGTDWEAFKSELKAVQLEACRLLDELTKPNGPGVAEPVDLQQIADYCKMTKPAIPGGNGKTAYWNWPDVLPFLRPISPRTLPDHFPGFAE